MIRRLLTALALLVVLTGCASGPDPQPATPSAVEPWTVGAEVMPAPKARALVDSGATLVDVRNPDEYAAGHVEGAESVPWESGDFDAAIEPLDRDATYVLTAPPADGRGRRSRG